MDIDYIEYDDEQLNKILDYSIDLHYYYNEYKHEAILCQNLNITTIENKKELINYCNSIFNFIDMIYQNKKISYENKNQITFNCKWFLYNILDLCINIYKL